MAYTTRLDKRKPDDIRETEAKVGIIPRADGSAMFRTGKTIAYAAVYGPRSMFPRFMQNPEKGTLRCHYSMMPFSSGGERVRPGPSRRSREISMVMEKALESVIDLKNFPNAVVDVFVDLPQTDAGTRCAGINAAAMALADAGIVMKDMIASIAVGRVDDAIVADLSYDEESYETDKGVADIPIAMSPNTGKITLLQMDGFLKKEELKKALELAKKACSNIYEIQKKALKEKFNVKVK